MVTATETQQIYSISDLTKLIKGELEETFQHIWVEGEISNLAMPRSGHIYFTLKDETSQLRAVLFKFASKRVTFQFEDGMQILARGSISVYEPRGEYQLILEYAEPRGAGTLQIAFEHLKRRLAEEGLFDAQHKHTLPLVPKKIGIVTSPSGAAIRDILNIISRRFANVQILIAPVLVQGTEAPGEIVRAIELFNRLPDVDVLIVGRGGGSIEDLWAFNDEAVARAIFASRIPIISAVGHEVDYTIADFVADVRAPTPSAAAELVVQNKINLVHTVQTMTVRLTNAMRNILERDKTVVIQAMRRLSDPRRRLGEWQQRVDDLHHRVVLGFRHAFDTKHYQFETIVGKLHSLSPIGLLARGYAICRKVTTLQVIKAVSQVDIGESVLVRVATGELECTVMQTHPQPEE